ncbi:putative trans-resveratrol di-O-methyltransferase [Rosa chinensis]|uniref:Putative trans-resveratrol di-O-methyltransferase n=1 Tax=Rosa chinensis TaxID=74649 RepID=A0A2P6R225_ROSCH|nr:trans-resveratrol di-O-methyltransferase [Rosa chinensis]PRQ40493.1 putative trans-resveratrol di-O-methyltransferase [Rosa chinensis]
MDLAINNSSSRELLQAQVHVWNHILKFINSMALKCAIQLGIPDIIHNHGQPITLSNLISRLNVHPSKSRFIYRLMRILVQSGFFVKHNDVHQEVVYSLTPSSELLLNDQPLKMTPFLLLLLDPMLIAPLHLLGSWFRKHGSTPFEMTYDMSFFDLGAHEPRFGSMFDEAMVADSELVSRVVIKECQGVFEGLNSIVDVGGGRGTMAFAIANAFPHIKCTVLDLPHVIDNLKGTNNLDFVVGDMFEKIPPANAILLKWILHDWNDEESVKILKRCREAISISKSDRGKVIIIDIVVTVDNKEMNNRATETQLLWDMLMMVNLTGRERTEKEWEKLFVAAGFTYYKISHTLGVRSLIEVYL